MGYQLLAELVLLLHLLFILFALLGGLLLLWHKWLIWLHIPAAVWASLIVWQRWICPLTPLENWFRHLAEQKGYSGGFIEHYLMPLIYPAGLTEPAYTAMALLALSGNLAIYSFVLSRWRKEASDEPRI